MGTSENKFEIPKWLERASGKFLGAGIIDFRRGNFYPVSIFKSWMFGCELS